MFGKSKASQKFTVKELVLMFKIFFENSFRDIFRPEEVVNTVPEVFPIIPLHIGKRNID